MLQSSGQAVAREALGLAAPWRSDDRLARPVFSRLKRGSAVAGRGEMRRGSTKGCV